MTTAQWIDYLSIVILIGFAVALVLLIALLWRANKVLYKLDHLAETFKAFVRDIVPAMVNIGTIATAVEAIIRNFGDGEIKKISKKKE